MKKIISSALLVLIFASSCTDNDDISSNEIIGTWTRSFEVYENLGTSGSWKYEFNDDGSLIASTILTDKSNNQILGYTFYAIGTYEINENTLVLSFLKSYSDEDYSELYSAVDDLNLTTVDFSWEFDFLTVSNKLFLDYVCGINESCANSTEEFNRVLK